MVAALAADVLRGLATSRHGFVSLGEHAMLVHDAAVGQMLC